MSFVSAPADVFGGGSKTDGAISSWSCTGGAPSKNTLADLFSAAYIDPSNGHTILYFGADRNSTSGDSNLGFWFMQDPTFGAQCGSTPNFTGTHVVGDVFVSVNYTNGGGQPTISLYTWNGSGITQNVTDAAACNPATFGAGQNECLIGNASATVSAPWQATPFPINGFVEGGIDLTTLFSGLQQTLPCFSSFLGATRASASGSAELKNFGVGNIDTCGSIELKKVWNGTPGSTKLGIGTGPNGTDIASKTVTTNDTTGPQLVQPGTYHVSETLANSNVSGQYSSSLSCVNTKNGGSAPVTTNPDTVTTGQSANLTLTTGDVVVCTYTNTLNNPKIAITKTADATSVSAGDPIGFTVNVSNPGTTVTNGVTVTDPLPAGVTWSLDTQSNSGLCALSGAVGSQSVTCGSSSTPLAAGASFSFHVTATTSGSLCATYNNTATVTTTNTPPGSASASITCHTASIQVLKTADAATVNAGDPIGYTVTVKNNGTGLAKGVTLTDALPAGTGAGVTWAIDSSTGNPTAFTLAGAKGSQTLTLAGQPITLAAGASLVVHITALTSGSECTTYNNSATVATTNDGTSTASALITCHPAAILVTKTADAGTVSAGDTIGYTVTVKNTGTGLAKGVVLTDALPAGSGTGVTWAIDGTTGNPAAFTLAGAKGSQTLTLAGQPITLAAGASLVVHITALTSGAECSTYNNTASVTTTNDGTSSQTASITCNTASIQVLKTADAGSVNAGDTIGYTVTVKNNGLGLAKGVTLNDALPAGSGTGVTWSVDGSVGTPAAFVLGGAAGSQTLTLAGQPISLGAGASLTVHITALTSRTECTTYNNTASVSTTNDGTSSQTALITCNPASIQVIKTADASPVNAGDTIGFTVTVKNNGTGLAKGVALTDALPEGTGSGVTWAIDGSTGNPAAFTVAGAKGSQTLTLAGQPITLAAGASLTVHITALTSGAECTSYNNSATVVTTNDGTSTSSASITCNPASIQVIKTADSTSVNDGDTIGYTVTVKNNGTGLAKGVTLTDLLPAGSGTGVTWAKDGSVGNPASFTLAGAKGSQTLTLAGQPITLAAGASLTVHITAATSLTECSTYDNTASVTTTNDGTSTSEAQIVCNSGAIQVIKTADASPVNAGDPIGFTVTIKNNGTGLAHGVTLTDALPAGTGSGVTWAIDGSTGNPSSFSLGGAAGSQTLTLAGQPITLGAGASLVVHITAATSGTECTTYDNTASVTTTNAGTSTSSASILCNPASIQVIKTADASPVNAGDTIGYTVTVKNNGTGLAKGVTLNDALPAGSGSGVTWAIDGSVGNPAAFTLGGVAGSQTLTLAGQPITLAAGASLTVHITAATSKTECTSYNNTASVSTTNDGTSSQTALITCNPASIQVIKTADASPVNAGDPIGFTVTVKNNGLGLARGVTLTDALPAGTGSGVTWAIDGSTGNPAAFTVAGAKGSQTLTLVGQPIPLPAGGSLTVHITALTSGTECTTYDNSATVTTTNDGTSTSSASITCNPASIQVIKTADAASVNAGDTIGYTVTVKNNGLGLAKGVTLNDALPAGSGTGVTWSVDGSVGTPAAFTLAGAKGSQTLTLAGQPITLAAGASLTVHITALTSGTECSTYNNTASVSTTNDGTSSQTALITCNPASIQVIKTADASPVNAGDPIGFTVTVKNNGTGLARGVTLTDALPAGSGSGVTWAIDGSTGNPAAFTVAGAKGSQTLTLAGQPITLAAGASLVVHITALTSGTECTTYNNSATVTTTNDGTSTSSASITCNPASIQVIKTADASSVNAGDTIGYTVTVKNNGTGLAKGVTLNDSLPAGSGSGVTWSVDGSVGTPAAFVLGGAAGSQTLTLAGQPISLAAGASLTVHITALTSRTECTTYDNTASVTTTNDGTSSSSASITCNPASIQVIKTADASPVNAGDTIGFTVTVKNNGTGLAKGVALSDALPAGTGSGVAWAIDGSTGNPAAFALGGSAGSQTLTLAGQPITLAAGASLTVHITALTSGTECTSYNNSATVVTTNDGTSTSSASITCNPASIQVIKTADASSVNDGDTIGYTVTVKNNGTGLAKGVTLNDSLPAGSGTGVTWSVDGSTGTPAAFTLAGAQGSQTLTLAGQPITLAAGASLTVHITAATSLTECSTYDNTASVTTTNDGTSSSEAQIVCNSGDIQVIKTADAASVNAGDTIGYTVTLKNNGTGLAHGVTLTDALPAGTGSGITWAIDGSTGNPASFTLGGSAGSQTLTLAGQPVTLDPGASLTVHITALTSGTECSTYDNTASVTTTNAGTSTSSATITCNPASIQVIKTADSASVNAGDTIGYTVTVKNNGTGLAKGVSLTDALPAGTGSGVTWAIDGSTGNPSSFSLGGSAGSQTLTLAGQPITLAAGASLTVHITAGTSGTECTTYNNTASVTTTNDGTSTSSATITCNAASIQVTKTADAASVNAGDPIGFTVTVKNNGTGLAKGVTLTDALPAGTGSGVTWAIDGSTGNPAAFTVAGGAGHQTLAFVGQPIPVPAGGTLTVHITALTSKTECTTYNNTASVTTTNDGTSSQSASITCNPASIHIVKTADAATVNQGSAVGFTVTVNNSGAGTAHGVTVNDPLPAGLSWSINTQSNTGLCAITGATGSQVLACGGSSTNVNAGASFSVHITATTAAGSCGTYNNTASVTTSNDGSGTSSASITCNPPPPPSGSPAISITKNPKTQSIASGGTASFTIVVTNTGTLALTNVSVSDPLSPNCNQTSSQIAALIGSSSMAPGASVTYNCSLANVTASFTNVATTTGTGSNGQTVTATDSAPVTVMALVPPIVPAPTPHSSIGIVKDPASQTIGQGGTAKFTITVTNTGDTTLSDVKVSDPLSTGCDKSLGTLAVGQSKSYSCTKTNVSADFENVATATGKPPTTAVVKATDHAQINVQAFVPPQHPKIAIVKSPKSQTLTTKLHTVNAANGSSNTIVTYGTAHFTIKVTNTGDVTLHNVKVTDPSSPGCDKAIGALASHASKTYSCTRSTVRSNFTNVATAHGTSPKGKQVEATDHAKVTVKVKTTSTSGAKFTG